MFDRNPFYESPSTLEQNDVIAVLYLFLIWTYFTLILVLLLLTLSMYLIAGFDIWYFSRF